jgi:hypothetical protein
MQKQVYDKREFRNLPRKQCAVSLLFGETVGPCRGLIHRHHVNPEDPSSRTIEVCNSHHQRLHAALRALSAPESEWRPCPHRPGTHRYPGAKEACERALNRDLIEAA